MNTPAYSKPPFIKFNDATGSGETFAGIKVRAYEFTKFMGGAAPYRDFATHWSTANAPEEKQVRLFHEDDMNRMLCLVHEKTNDIARRELRITQLKDELQTLSEQRENQAETIEELNELVGLAIAAMSPGATDAYINTVRSKLKDAHLHGAKPVFKKNASDFVWQYRNSSGGWTNTHHSNVQALRADGFEVRCMAEITLPTEPFVAPAPEGFGLNPTLTMADISQAIVEPAKLQPFMWDGRTPSMIGSLVTVNGKDGKDPEVVYDHIVLGTKDCDIEALEQLFAGTYGGKLPEVGQEVKLICTNRTENQIFINMVAVPAPHNRK